MAELLSGRSALVFFREEKNHATEDGTRYRFQTEVSMSEEKENESTPTTDGVVNSISDGENTIELSSVAYTDDEETTSQWRELRGLFRKNTKMEVWIIYNTGEEEQDADYAQGYFTSFEMSAAADGQIELSASFAIDGTPKEGTERLTAEQLGLMDAGYEYRSVKANGEAV